MKINKLLATVIAGSLFFVSCSSDDDSVTPSGAYDNGVLILNEGGYNAGNASVSFLSQGMTLESNIFSSVNGMPLGDVGQDIGFHDGRAYIVLNNSHKIEVVNRYTFEKQAAVSNGLDNPRYIAFSGNKGYVTNWGDPEDAGDDFIAVIDLSSNTVTTTIPVPEGPEAILEEDGKLYIAHYGGYNFGNEVTVINTATNTVTASITVGDAPESMAIEDGKLYVLSEGIPSWAGTETTGSLHVINLANNSVAASYSFPGMSHPSNLVIEDDKLYYTIDSGIYRMGLSASELPSSPLFTTTEQGVYGVYSFAVNDNHIFVGDAMDYNSNGKVYIYSLAGALEQTFTVGVIPAGFYFND